MGKLSFGSTGYAYSITEHKFDQSDVSKCSRCKQKVFLTEQQKVAGKIWHKKCLTCGKCKKSLQSSNALSHQGDIYCSPCHKRVSSVSGPVYPGTTLSSTCPGTNDAAKTQSTDYRMNQTEHTLTQNESQRRSAAGVISNRPVKKMDFTAPPGVNDKCPVCGKRVYFAEELKAHKKNWHKSCFKCVTCQKTLTPGRSNEHGNHLYCQPCYSKHYGPKGYSSGGNQSLSVDDREHIESKHSRTHHHSDSSYDSEEMFVIHRRNASETYSRNQEDLRQEDSVRISNQPIREEEPQYQPIREEEQQYQPIRAEEFQKQPSRDEQFNKRLIKEEEIQYKLVEEKDYQSQPIRTDFQDQAPQNIPQLPTEKNRNSQYNNGQSTEERFQDMNLNNNVDEVFNNNQQQQYYANENIPVDQRNANNGNHTNEQIKYEQYSNEPIRRERYSNEPIRRERFSNEYVRQENAVDKSIRRRSMPQEIYAQPKRLSSSTAAIRDENIVYSIDQKVKPKLIISKKASIADEIRQNARMSSATDHYDAPQNATPVHQRYHSDSLANVNGNDFYSPDRRYGKDQESIDSGYGGNQQNRISKYEDYQPNPVMSQSFQGEMYDPNSIESRAHSNRNSQVIYQNNNNTNVLYNAIPRETLWNKVATDITRDNQSYGILDRATPTLR